MTNGLSLTRIVYLLAVIIIAVLAFPAFTIIGGLIVCVNGFPILFRQKRSGKNGKQFTIYKFRTMVTNAEVIKKRFVSKNEADGPVFKIRNDPRYTRIGKFLAHTGLDELPQLFNVLCGDMALIGPRPLPVSEAKKLKPWQKERQAITPGIISPWIVNGYHRQSFDAWMRSDIEYIKQKSFAYDLWLTLRTFKFLCTLFIKEIAR